MSEENTVLKKWEELKTLVESLEMDVAKNARGVAAAGVRLRKGLRTIQRQAKDFVKFTVERDKTAQEKE